MCAGVHVSMCVCRMCILVSVWCVCGVCVCVCVCTGVHVRMCVCRMCILVSVWCVCGVCVCVCVCVCVACMCAYVVEQLLLIFSDLKADKEGISLPKTIL